MIINFCGVTCSHVYLPIFQPYFEIKSLVLGLRIIGQIGAFEVGGASVFPENNTCLFLTERPWILAG